MKTKLSCHIIFPKQKFGGTESVFAISLLDYGMSIIYTTKLEHTCIVYNDRLNRESANTIFFILRIVNYPEYNLVV